MSLTDLVVPTYTQMLGGLCQWLDKAATQLGPDKAEALLSARIAPDMFPLATQVRFACVQAYEGVARLSDEPIPSGAAALLDEGRKAGEQPGTIAQAQDRIRETLAMLNALAPCSLDSEPHRPIAHTLPMGMTFDLTAQQYARDWTLPQFYFHLMIAYAILRQGGVELGKADYVQHMFAYLRPEAAPSD